MTAWTFRKIINKQSPTILQVVIALGGWLPLLSLVFRYTNHQLGANPIQALEQTSGRIALTFLLLSLACTPINLISGWREPLKRRRALGLFAFLYACLHLFTLVVLDYNLEIGLLIDELAKKRHIIPGIPVFLILMVLALTSFSAPKRWLGRNWKRLHTQVYPAAILAVLHYSLAQKGDLFNLQGDILKPLIYGLILFFLLVIRIKPVRNYLRSHPLFHREPVNSHKAIRKSE